MKTTFLAAMAAVFASVNAEETEAYTVDDPSVYDDQCPACLYNQQDFCTQ